VPVFDEKTQPSLSCCTSLRHELETRKGALITAIRRSHPCYSYAFGATARRAPYGVKREVILPVDARDIEIPCQRWGYFPMAPTYE